jgi:3-hydroxyacyl-CoA dehydrogenase
MRLAEIVRTDQTSDAVVDVVAALASRCGKRPVVVRENPRAWGYVANRVLRAAVREAELVVAEGVAPAESVDTIMVDAFGWPVGPLSVLAGAADGWGDRRGGSVAGIFEGS